MATRGPAAKGRWVPLLATPRWVLREAPEANPTGAGAFRTSSASPLCKLSCYLPRSHPERIIPSLFAAAFYVFERVPPPPLSLPFPRLNNPGSFKLSSFLAASSPLTVLAALPALPPFGPHPPGNAASKPGRCRQQQECSARLAKHAAPPRPPVT